MPTTLSITLDASQFNAAVAEVDANAKKMGQDVAAAGNAASTALSGIDQSARKVATSAVQSGGALGKTFDAAGQKINKAGGAVSAVGTAFGAASPKLAVFGQALQALASGPIGLVTAAIGALVTIGVKVWDAMSESTEEYAAKCEQAANAAQKAVEKTDKQAAAAAGYLAKLAELNSAENASNAARQMTIDTLKVLQKSYGDLGAVIDKTTGKIINFSEIEAKVREASATQKADALEKQAEALQQQARAEYVKTKSDEAGTTETGALTLFLQAKSDGVVLSDWIQKQAIASNEADDIAAYGRAADLMRKAEELFTQADSLRESGYASKEEETAATLAAQERRAKARGSYFDASDAFKDRRREDALSTAIEDGKSGEALRQLQEYTAKLDAEKRALEESAKKAVDAMYQARKSGAEIRIADTEAAQYRIDQQILDVNQKIYEAKKKAAAVQKEQQKQSENLQKSLRDSAVALAQNAADAVDKGKELAEVQALLKARDTKGADLTDDERDQVKRISALTWEMNHRVDPSLGELAIRTNSLTARGGFASGAVMPEPEKINREIARSAKDQTAKLGEIIRLVQGLAGSQRDTEVQRIRELLSE